MLVVFLILIQINNLRGEQDMEKKMLYPPYLQWEVTPRCNHNCVHCYNYWRTGSDHYEDCKNHMAIAKKIVENKPVSVVITGGEPLLVFECLKEPIKLFKANGIAVSINTNATLVTSDIAKFLAEHNVSAFVSLPCDRPKICDSITGKEGSFGWIIEGIQLLRAAGVMVTANMVVSKENLAYIYETAEFAHDYLGLTRFFASRVSKPINSGPEFDIRLLNLKNLEIMESELLRAEKELGLHTESSTPIPACSFERRDLFDKFAYTHKCTAGKTSYAIDTLGNIKACPRDSENYGNILTDDFNEVWDKMESWRDGSYIPKDCKKCKKVSECAAGCRLDAYPLTGKKNSLDPSADVVALPVKFEKKSTLAMFAEEQEFVVSKEMRAVEENGGWRLSVGRQYVVATHDLKVFLESRTKFCLAEFAHSLDAEYDLANKAINWLVKKHILDIGKIVEPDFE